MHAQTKRQREVLDFITRYIESHGYRPSYQVIARHMGVSSRAGIGRIVRDLEHQGFLERQRVDGHFAIAIMAERRPPQSSFVEWLQFEGAERDSNVPAPFALPEVVTGGQDPAGLRAFRVPDDSMVAECIRKGDIALIQIGCIPQGGDVVVAMAEDVMRLRKYRRVGARVELSGPEAEVINLAAEDVEILGVYRGLVRPLL